MLRRISSNISITKCEKYTRYIHTVWNKHTMCILQLEFPNVCASQTVLCLWIVTANINGRLFKTVHQILHKRTKVYCINCSMCLFLTMSVHTSSQVPATTI